MTGLDRATARIVTAGLEECEEVIEQGLATFLDVGSALIRIRDARLYRQEYATFDVYCMTRWGFSDRRARHLMEAAQVGTMVPVENERQARELVPLLAEPERLAIAWQQVVDETGGKPTAAALRSAVRPSPTSPASASAAATAAQSASTNAGEPATPEEFLAQRDTSEVLSPEDWQAQPEPNPLAAARAEVARQPAMVATAGIDYLRKARKAFEAAGTSAAIVADLDNDNLVDRTGDWLHELDATLPLLNDLTTRLRRRNLRSVKP